MSLKEKISSEMKQAMRDRAKVRLGAIRLILADMKRIEVDERIEIDDSRAILIMDKMIKQRKDSIEQYTKANRLELADVEKNEIDIIREFLPQPLTEAEITSLIASAVAEVGATSIKDMGKVMGLVKPKILGRADAGAVSQQIKQRLS